MVLHFQQLYNTYLENTRNNENAQANHSLVFVDMKPFSILLPVLRGKSSSEPQLL